MPTLGGRNRIGRARTIPFEVLQEPRADDKFFERLESELFLVAAELPREHIRRGPSRWRFRIRPAVLGSALGVAALATGVAYWAPPGPNSWVFGSTSYYSHGSSHVALWDAHGVNEAQASRTASALVHGSTPRPQAGEVTVTVFRASGAADSINGFGGVPGGSLIGGVTQFPHSNSTAVRFVAVCGSRISDQACRSFLRKALADLKRQAPRGLR